MDTADWTDSGLVSGCVPPVPMNPGLLVSRQRDTCLPWGTPVHQPPRAREKQQKLYTLGALCLGCVVSHTSQQHGTGPFALCSLELGIPGFKKQN